MKKLLAGVGLTMLVIFGMAQSTFQRGPVGTTEFSRRLLTNESASAIRDYLGVTTNGGAGIDDLNSTSNVLQNQIDATVPEAGGLMTGKLTNYSGIVGNGLSLTGVVAQATVTQYVATAGGTMTGTLTNPAGFYGPAFGATNVNGTNVLGTLTNNTTGNAASSTLAATATLAPTYGPTNRPTFYNPTNAGTSTFTGSIEAQGGINASNSGYSNFGINNSATVGSDAFGGSNRQLVGVGNGFLWISPGGSSFKDWNGNNDFYLSTIGYNPNTASVELIPRWNGFAFLNSAAAGGRSIRMPVSSFAPRVGGSAASMEDLPINGSEMVPAMPVPPIVISTWSGVSTNLTEASVSNYIKSVSDCGALAVWTNNNINPWLHIDSNTRWLTNNRSSGGKLVINNTSFPSTTNFIDTLHTNGWKVSLTIYGWDVPTNQISLHATTFAAGSGTDYQTAMSPNTAIDDVSTMMEWHLDGIRWSDLFGDVGYSKSFAQAIVNGCLAPIQGGTYFNRAYTDGNNLGRAVRPMSLWYVTTAIGTGVPQLWKEANFILHDQATSPIGNGASIGTSVGLMNFFRGEYYYEIPFQSKGHFGQGISTVSDLGVELARLSLSTAAIGLGGITIAWQTNTTMVANYPNLTVAITNVEFLKIHQDVACLNPQLLWDNGATNTSAWSRRLNDGGIAIFLANESASATNSTVTWTQLGIATNTIWDAYSVWGNTNGPQVNYGSLTMSVPANGCRLIKLNPTQPVVQNMPALAGSFPSQVSSNAIETAGAYAGLIWHQQGNDGVQYRLSSSSGDPNYSVFYASTGGGIVAKVPGYIFNSTVPFQMFSDLGVQGYVIGTNGLASGATNRVLNTSINAAGWTNTTAVNMNLNLSGTSIVYEFYNSSGVAVFTNTITSASTIVPVPKGAGVRFTTYTAATAQAYAQ